MKDNKNMEEKKMHIKEAQKVCCDITGIKDFGLISKVHLALAIRNLVLDFHKKKDEIEKLTGENVLLRDRLKYIEKFGKDNI